MNDPLVFYTKRQNLFTFLENNKNGRRVNLQRYKDELALQLFGKTLADAHNEHICVQCKNPQGEFRDLQSEKEYSISGLCQACQDEIFETGDHDGTIST